MKHAAEWFLTLREIPLEHAHKIIITNAPAPDPKTPDLEEDSQPVSLYGIGISTEEGFWGRSGWASKS